MTAPKKRTPAAGPTARRKPGRPRNNPPTGPATPQAAFIPDPITPPDDKAAQTVADRLADAVADAAGPKATATGGRPTTRQAGMSELAENLAVIYEAIGKGLLIPGALFSMNPSTAAFAQRLTDIGNELVASADKCGIALARWADTNDKVKKFLTGSSAHAGMLLVVAVHIPIIGAAVGRGEQARFVADVAETFVADPTAPGPSAAAGFDMGAMFNDILAGLTVPATPGGADVIDTTATELEPDAAAA